MATKEQEKRTRGGGIMLPGLRETRLDAGYSLHELEEMSGVPAATINKLELLQRGAMGRTVRKLSEALNVEVRDLRTERMPSEQ